MSEILDGCCFCGEDAMYFDHIGPWCEECYRTIRDAAELAEIEQLRAERDECRRLLRECCQAMQLLAGQQAMPDDSWEAVYEAARAAGGLG